MTLNTKHWEDDIYGALQAIGAEVATWPKRSIRMAEDHPVAKHQRYLGRMEYRQERRKRPGRRRR